MTTPKMPGMTPQNLQGSFGYSPALLGQSPVTQASQLLMNKLRSPVPSQQGLPNFSSPGTLSALGLPGNAFAIPTSIGTPQMPQMTADETKKRELREISRLLSTRPGRISEAAVERLAKGMGLECYKEVASSGVTTLSLAANIFLIDIEFAHNRIKRVALSFENTTGPSKELAPRAEAIFYKNLTAPSGSEQKSILAPSLAPFAENLNRLAKTDRLSTTSLNCFTAITGVYQSLLKIFEYEKLHMEGGEIAAMCHGSGRPAMHVRGKVGLSVDYWKYRRHIPSKVPTEEEELDDSAPIWRVIIEVEEIPVDFGNMNAITPVRSTDHWVSDEVKKPRHEDNLFGELEEPVTDWFEPPLEELIAPDDPSQSRPPSARFLARLDPPVAIPFQDEMELYNNLMMGPPAGDLGPIEKQLFPNLPTSGEKSRRLYIPPDSGELDSDDVNDVTHNYTLHAGLKPVFGRHLSEIPFSHPKELLPIFKVLRQYALVSTLLKSSFDEKNPDAKSPERDEDEEMVDTLDSFLADTDGPVPSKPLPVDITLAPEQGFGIVAVFPCLSGLANLRMQVGRNAELGCEVELNRNVGAKGKGTAVDQRMVEKALGMSEDLGLVVEWVKRFT